MLIITFVIGCLELSRNDSGSYPFNPFIWYWIAKFFKADLDWICWNKVSVFSYIILILFFKDSTTFGFGGMLVNSHSSKSVFHCIPLVMKFCMFCLFFVAIFDSLQGVGCKARVGSFRIGSSKILLVCSTNLAASKACNNSPFLSL